MIVSKYDSYLMLGTIGIIRFRLSLHLIGAESDDQRFEIEFEAGLKDADTPPRCVTVVIRC
jgi:hypothetical protein